MTPSLPEIPRKFKQGNVVGIGSIQLQLKLRLELVSRLEALPFTSLGRVQYMTNDGEIILIPGPVQLAADNNKSAVENDEIGMDDTDRSSMMGSSLASSPDMLSKTERNEPHFIVRNEFAHIRIQPMVELLESMEEDGIRHLIVDENGNNRHKLDVLKIAGHCILSPEHFEHYLADKKGIQHPFAGQYHPIVGTTIPENTLLFFAPNSMEDLDVTWQLLKDSYAWAIDALPLLSPTPAHEGRLSIPSTPKPKN